MAKPKDDRILFTEHVLEIRHAAVGLFLDVRGHVADYIRQEGFFPHWKIDSNVVNFRDESDAMKIEGAFVGYKSAGYVALNPKTRNYFVDRASSFWKGLIKNKHYNIPIPKRFGTRTKFFFPLTDSFDEINNTIYKAFFTDTARKLVGGQETDLQFTIDLQEEGFGIRVIGGPIKKDEADRYFQFEAEEFGKCGIYLDMDYFKTENISLQDVPKLLKKADALAWQKAEQITTGLGY